MKRATPKKKRQQDRANAAGRNGAHGAILAYHERVVKPLAERLKAVEGVLERSLRAALAEEESLTEQTLAKLGPPRIPTEDDISGAVYSPGCPVCNPPADPSTADSSKLCSRHVGVVRIVENEEAL